ncbi:MAG: transcriptional regulator [Verrucomicrobia bacterium]|nr:transcriptional regulator [Verrucomicrobiota bacterium]
MKIRVIRDEAGYQTALTELEKLMDANPPAGSAKAEEIELLTMVIQAYERERFHFCPPDPIEAIKFRLEQAGKTPDDLASYLGGRSVVREVLAGKRPLTLRMIRALHRHLEIPAEVLIAKPA